jgi:hypothetical protein
MAALRYIHVTEYSAIIFRRTYPDLEDLIHRAIAMYCAPGLDARYRGDNHQFTFPSGARVRFSHLQYSKDIYTHQGQQYDFIGFDELCHFPRSAYIYLFSRLRGTHDGIARLVRSTGNPDGEGVLWVKERFVDTMQPLETAWFRSEGEKDLRVPYGTKGAISRAYVPCVRDENRALMDNDPEYEARLDQLPEAQKRALKFGSWEIADQSNQIVTVRWWNDATMGKCKHVDGPYSMGLDYAHEGHDKTVLVLGKGNRVLSVESWARTRTTEVARMLAERLHKYGMQMSVAGIDSIGPGVGVWDVMRDLYPDISHKVEPCQWKDAEFDKRLSGLHRFNSLRCQMWWKFRMDMEAGAIDLSALPGDFVDLGRMQQDVFAHRYETRILGRIEVTSKAVMRKASHLGRSPDFADALVIWNWVRERGVDGAQSPDRRRAEFKDYRTAEDVWKMVEQQSQAGSIEGVVEETGWT